MSGRATAVVRPPSLAMVAPRPRSVLRRLLSDPVAAAMLILLAALVGAALLAPAIAPYDPYESDLANVLKTPGEAGLLGADGQGRDMVTRLLFGLRMTLLMALASVSTGCTIGALAGLAAAYFPRISGLLMRSMDVLLSFPAILVGLALAAIAGPGIVAVVIALAIATIPLMARVVRGSAIVVLQQDFIESARALGMTDTRLVLRHLLPNCLSAIFVFVTLRIGQVILLAASLSFIGLGAQPPIAELGAMTSEGRNFLFFAPHVVALPSFLIFLIVLAFNVLGDALRDVLDPKLRRQS
jgi:peptide/nickel transport system permease protein